MFVVLAVQIFIGCWLSHKHRQYTGQDGSGQAMQTEKQPASNLFDCGAPKYKSYMLYSLCCIGPAGSDLNKRKMVN